MLEVDVLVVGGGPAGLCAAARAAHYGAKVLLVDENQQPGGQLFKQIHKFFGSKDHQAGVRGFDIGRRLLRECSDYGAHYKKPFLWCFLNVPTVVPAVPP
jgi:NADPH-dependent 2,4-dienoyl-CoA reductase/sulfur reductase-like enzyme